MVQVFQSINNAFCNFLGINSYIQGVIIMMCINIIAVLGMSVLTGFTRLFSFGNAGFMSIGAYTAAILTVRYHVNFLIAILIGAAFAGLIAWLLGSLTLKLHGDYFLISCLGFGECVRVLFNYFKKAHRRFRRLPRHPQLLQHALRHHLRSAGVLHRLALHPLQVRPQPHLHP